MNQRLWTAFDKYLKMKLNKTLFCLKDMYLSRCVLGIEPLMMPDLEAVLLDMLDIIYHLPESNQTSQMALFQHVLGLL